MRGPSMVCLWSPGKFIFTLFLSHRRGIPLQDIGIELICEVNFFVKYDFENSELDA
jgi:hypothetical protein